jgi:hypothetical protein
MGTQAVRKNWIWIALMLSFAATIWVSMTDDGGAAEVVAVSVPRPLQKIATAQPQRSMPNTSDAFSIERLQRPKIDTEPGDLFPSAEAQQQDSPAEPPPPSAPSLPYSYAGRLVEDGQLIIFLLRGTRHYSIQLGETIDGTWQLVSASAQQLVFNHIPTRLEVVMPIGESH